MKKITKHIFIFLVLYLSFTINSNSVYAEIKEYSFDSLPNSSKLIDLNYNNKPLSTVLNKIAKKAKLNIIYAPTFKDNSIIVKLNNVSINAVSYTHLRRRRCR